MFFPWSECGYGFWGIPQSWRVLLITRGWVISTWHITGDVNVNHLVNAVFDIVFQHEVIVPFSYSVLWKWVSESSLYSSWGGRAKCQLVEGHVSTYIIWNSFVREICPITPILLNYSFFVFINYEYLFHTLGIGFWGLFPVSPWHALILFYICP